MTKKIANNACFILIISLALVYILYLFIIIGQKPSSSSYQNILAVTTKQEPSFRFILTQRDLRKKGLFSKTELHSYVKKMPLEAKVGQMIMGGPFNNDLLQKQLSMIESHNFGGIIIMGSSVNDLSTTLQTTELIRQYQNKLQIPLFISIDEEGGVVTRLGYQLTEQTPQSQVISTDHSYRVGFNRGSQLSKAGINMNFSPVLDSIQEPTSFLYDRVFHLDKQKNAELAIAMINGYREAEIISVPKHYPGHPDDTTDSHKGLPVSNIQANQFNEYTRSFRLLALNRSPDVIMCGHIYFPEISTYPSSLSYELLTEKLRGEYGFSGVIITDDLNMDAISNQYTTEEAAVLAVKAGNDILLYVTDTNIQERAFNAILAAVRSGDLDEDRINESVERILSLKRQYLGWDPSVRSD